MIDFQDFGIEDIARYRKYLSRCMQIPSNLSPAASLGGKDKFNIRRGFAAELFWHKFTNNGSEYWSAPVGDWDEINWRAVFQKHVPAWTVFDNVPEYLVKL